MHYNPLAPDTMTPEELRNMLVQMQSQNAILKAQMALDTAASTSTDRLERAMAQMAEL